MPWLAHAWLLPHRTDPWMAVQAQLAVLSAIPANPQSHTQHMNGAQVPCGAHVLAEPLRITW